MIARGLHGADQRVDRGRIGEIGVAHLDAGGQLGGGLGILRSTELAIRSIRGLGLPGLRKRGVGSVAASSRASRRVSSAALLRK